VILAGDIGATNTRLAWFGVADRTLRLGAARTYPSQRHASLDEIVAVFVREVPGSLRHACFGIAGPVRDGRAEGTNLPWVVDARQVAAGLGLDQVILLNDLEANAWGLGALQDTDFAVLQPGRPAPTGNAAVISAGTGLGEAGLVWDGRRHRPVASEAGHADWAPRDAEQLALWQFLASEVGHVSVERVLSGPGLHNIYRFLRDGQGVPEPGWLTDALRTEDPAPVISQMGLRAGRRSVPARSASSWRSTAPRRATSASACWRPPASIWEAASPRESSPRCRGAHSSMPSAARGRSSRCSRRFPCAWS
jgi:glucokinase